MTWHQVVYDNDAQRPFTACGIFIETGEGDIILLWDEIAAFATKICPLCFAPPKGD